MPLTLRVLAVLAFTTAVFTAPSSAETRRVRQACTADIHKLCPREKSDSPSLRYCMEANGRYLSKSCIRALEDDGEIPRGYFDR